MFDKIKSLFAKKNNNENSKDKETNVSETSTTKKTTEKICSFEFLK